MRPHLNIKQSNIIDSKEKKYCLCFLVLIEEMTNNFGVRTFSLFFLFFFLFMAAPVAYGSSQARGRIGATPTATKDLSHVCNLHHSSWQH